MYKGSADWAFIRKVKDALIADGCFIEGADIESSVIGIRSRIGRGVKIRRSLMLGSDDYETPEEIAAAQKGGEPPVGIGDGSLMYSVQALWTAAQHRLPLSVVVLNNRGYGAMRSFSRVMGTHSVPGIELPGLDFTAIARGHGCATERVEKAGALDEALAWALASDGPALLDVAVDAAVPTLYRPAGEDAR